MEEETLVLGGKDGIDEHFRNLLEVNEAAVLALLACEIVHELRLKTIPGRFFVAIIRTILPIRNKTAKRQARCENDCGPGGLLDLIAADPVVPGTAVRIPALLQLRCNLS